MKPGTPGSDPLLLHLDPWTFPKHDDRKRIAAKLRKEIQEVEFELEHEVELIKALDRITGNALEKGKLKAREVYEENLAQALRNGAGPAHKITAVDGALPPLRLVIEEETSEGKT